MTLLILIICSGLFIFAYLFYAPFLAKIFKLNADNVTPANRLNDGVDYYPAKAPVLFGHHFASIAGAAPIIGPIVALTYGWGAVLLWVLFGGIFFGAVHDFSALATSIRHDGKSMGEVIGECLGSLGKTLFLIFLWSTIILVIAAFLIVVAQTFQTSPTAATSSTLFIPLAIVFGISIYKLKFNLLFSSIFGVTLLALCIVAGQYLPISLTMSTWIFILVVYIFFASILPVWLLLQPRDYLNSFLLYSLIIIAILGLFTSRPPINYPIFVAWTDPQLGPIFPILFVTVACGAISGFHSVVASGTTAKQLNKETDAIPVGYGAMLIESLLSVLVILVVIGLTRTEFISSLKIDSPITLFSNGIGGLLGFFGIDAKHGTNFATLAVSAFVLTSLDTATRLGRFAFQELFSGKTKFHFFMKNRYVSTTITVGVAYALAFSGGWKSIWPIFGTANQLLAAFALLAVLLWLRKIHIKRGFIYFPMISMFIITITALLVLIKQKMLAQNYLMGSIALALLILTIVMIINTVYKIASKKSCK